jgi:hypothetical protein
LHYRSPQGTACGSLLITVGPRAINTVGRRSRVCLNARVGLTPSDYGGLMFEQSIINELTDLKIVPPPARQPFDDSRWEPLTASPLSLTRNADDPVAVALNV